MEKQGNITLLDFTNFLENGAFLRCNDHWHLFSEAEPAANSPQELNFDLFFPHFFDIEAGKTDKYRFHFILQRHQLAEVITRYLEQQKYRSAVTDVGWEEPQQQAFDKVFSQIQQLISQNQIDKAVPVVFSTSPFSVNRGDQAYFLLNLLDAHKNLFPYGCWQKNSGVIGATPELLFDLKGNEIHSMALAGTVIVANGDAEKKILENEKIRREHRPVVDDIAQQLGSFGRVIFNGPSVLELPGLCHLRTDLRVNSSIRVYPLDLARRLHPTPALGVSPRSFGWRSLREIDGAGNRGRFGSPMLVRLSDSHYICLVAIRNLQWTEHQARIGAGCGIIQESDIVSEWEELFHKRQSVKKLLGILK